MVAGLWVETWLREGVNALQVGIALRTIGRGYIPDKSFIIVTVVITLVLMVGWRTGLAALTPEQVDNPYHNLRFCICVLVKPVGLV
jgi:hypothetical protein